MNENKSTTINTIKERVVKLETQYQFICEKLYDIQNNDLVHINKKLDEIDDKCNNLDKKVGEMAIKVGIIFAVATYDNSNFGLGTDRELYSNGVLFLY